MSIWTILTLIICAAAVVMSLLTFRINWNTRKVLKQVEEQNKETAARLEEANRAQRTYLEPREGVE